MEAPGTPFMLSDYPRAIAHLDGDAFFASVEQAMHPEWRGRPLVTGKERGIIACASYEAKALGIKRGLPLHEAVKQCPSLVVVPSDYETYSLYSKRMFDIMRRFTPMVEAYSIDEGFADLTGLRRVFRLSYEALAARMRETVQDELGLGVSLGLSTSKSLAKLGSKHHKPQGFTAIPGTVIHQFLSGISLEQVWGFGVHTVALLQKHGLRTALDFVSKPEAWAGRWLGKVGRELWRELRGQAVYPVSEEMESVRYSISKCKSFTAPSDDADWVYAKAVRNLESAMIKLRRHHMRARVLALALRTRSFRQAGMEAALNRSTMALHEMLPLLRRLFEALYVPGEVYRATQVVLSGLESDHGEQLELFQDPLRMEAMARVSQAMDALDARFGKHVVSVGTSLHLARTPQGPRDELPLRKQALLRGESPRRRLRIPRWFIEV